MISQNSRHKQIALRYELVDDIQKYINTHLEEGYTSVPEFIREAIRHHLKDMNEMKKL